MRLPACGMMAVMSGYTKEDAERHGLPAPHEPPTFVTVFRAVADTNPLYRFWANASGLRAAADRSIWS